MELTAQSNDADTGGKKVYDVPPIIPGPGFIIEIKERDGDQSPVKNVEFKYIVDTTINGSDRTDGNGTLVVKPMPKSEVKVLL